MYISGSFLPRAQLSGLFLNCTCCKSICRRLGRLRPKDALVKGSPRLSGVRTAPIKTTCNRHAEKKLQMLWLRCATWTSDVDSLEESLQHKSGPTALDGLRQVRHPQHPTCTGAAIWELKRGAAICWDSGDLDRCLTDNDCFVKTTLAHTISVIYRAARHVFISCHSTWNETLRVLEVIVESSTSGRLVLELDKRQLGTLRC